MRRYIPLVWLAFFVFSTAFVGNIYLAGYADQSGTEPAGSIVVYTDLPVETAAALAEEYEKGTKVRVNFIPLSREEIIERLKVKDRPLADALLASESTLRSAQQSGALAGYSSEQADIVPERFKEANGTWVGVWYDPIVFCANRDYLKNAVVLPTGWESLAASPNVRIGITDFLAADASAQLLFALASEYGEEAAFRLLKILQPHVVQYAKYLITPVRMAAMSEVDVAVAVQSEAMRYVNDGFPVRIIYPEQGTSYMLTGAAILKRAEHAELAEEFVRWLLQDDVQMCLQKNRFFFVPTNQELLSYKVFAGKNLRLFEKPVLLDQKQKERLLDQWVKKVRLVP